MYFLPPCLSQELTFVYLYGGVTFHGAEWNRYNILSVFYTYIYMYVYALQHLAVYIIYVIYKQLALEGIPQWLKH